MIYLYLNGSKHIDTSSIMALDCRYIEPDLTSDDILIDLVALGFPDAALRINVDQNCVAVIGDVLHWIVPDRDRDILVSWIDSL